MHFNLAQGDPELVRKPARPGNCTAQHVCSTQLDDDQVTRNLRRKICPERAGGPHAASLRAQARVLSIKTRPGSR